MAVHYVILECDWFVLGSQRLIKQLAFYDTYNHVTRQCVFRFPEWLRRYATYFARQSENSRHIPWNKLGFFHLCDVSAVIQTMKHVARAQQVIFLAKGLENTNILSRHGVQVINLEDIDCPTFDELSSDPPTTGRKAKVFADWFMCKDVRLDLPTDDM